MMRRATTRGFMMQHQQSRRRAHSNITTSSNNNNNIHPGRPLVVLCGWLGCQLPQLRKYEELWHGLGFDVHGLVASPVAVVDACLNLQEHDVALASSSSSGSSMQHNNHLPPFESKITDWGRHVSNILQEKQPEFFFLHVFSNGGCFVFESLSRLWEKQTASQTHLRDQQQSRCKGVIMDSCPAWFGTHPEGLWKVLQTCPKEEMDGVVRIYGEEALRQLNVKNGLQRNEEYFAHVAKSQPNMPQLYLYSDDDPFADATYIRGLIEERQQDATVTAPVIQQRWTNSKHCAHLREHPEEYQRAIQEFVKGVMKNDVSPQRSKL